MKSQIIEIEKELDDKISKLSIFNLPFQTVYSILLYTAETIDLKGKSDTASDYLSRLSLIYNIVKKNSKKSVLVNTTEALSLLNESYIEDINFIVAYAHFSMLMPQIHRDSLTVKSIENNEIKLIFKNQELENSELIDKLYSVISIPISFNSNNKELHSNTLKKAENRDYNINADDFILIEKLYKHHLNYTFNVKTLSDTLLNSKLGFTNTEYHKFVASFKAFSDYFISLARNYKNQINTSNSKQDNEKLMLEYSEFSVCCLTFKTLGWFIAISGLSKQKFDLILSYFLDIYSDNTGENFISNSFVGDGYQVPITLMDTSIIFSPLSIRYLLSFNNILYSINKNQKTLFDNHISNELEPTLINQIEYLFSKFTNLELRKNISYSKSEIDLMILSKKENLCLCIQVKTTIAPDSSRTVARVEKRIIEASNQIDIFQKIGQFEQLKLINRTFKSNISKIKIVNLIIVRSSAGSEKSWNINKQYKIINYILLAKLLCDKLQKKDFYFINIEAEILEKQNELIKKSLWSINNETLIVGKYNIEFPNINYDETKIIPTMLNSMECYTELEDTH